MGDHVANDPDDNTERDIEDRVRQTSGYRGDILPSTNLYHDLGIYGDDAFYLLKWISETYGMSFENFSFDDFFPGEALVSLLPLRRLLRLRGRPRRPLPLGHLLEAAKRGKWFDPSDDDWRLPNRLEWP